MIINFYLISMLTIGFYVQRRGGIESANGYLVANRNVGPILIGGTLFATFCGGGTLPGSAGAAYGRYLLGTIADPWASGSASSHPAFIIWWSLGSHCSSPLSSGQSSAECSEGGQTHLQASHP